MRSFAPPFPSRSLSGAWTPLLSPLSVRAQAGLLLLVLGFLCPTASARAKTLDLDQVLERMQRRAAHLHSMRCSLEQKKWTDILEEFDEGESGTFSFLRHKGKTYLRRDIQKPHPHTLVIREGQLLFYQPRIKQLQKYTLGRQKDRAEFMLLGFGADAAALRRTYRVRLLPSEKVAGRLTYPLELVPRSRSASAYFSTIVLWMDATLWVPVQQKLVEPTGDYLLIRFDDIELNPRMARSHFDLKVPKDVRVVGQ